MLIDTIKTPYSQCNVGGLSHFTETPRNFSWKADETVIFQQVHFQIVYCSKTVFKMAGTL